MMPIAARVATPSTIASQLMAMSTTATPTTTTQASAVQGEGNPTVIVATVGPGSPRVIGAGPGADVGAARGARIAGGASGGDARTQAMARLSAAASAVLPPASGCTCFIRRRYARSASARDEPAAMPRTCHAVNDEQPVPCPARSDDQGRVVSTPPVPHGEAAGARGRGQRHPCRFTEGPRTAATPPRPRSGP